GIQAIAYTAGSANMLVVTQGPETREGARSLRLVVPKPFGPTVAEAGPVGSAAPACVFETEIARLLALSGTSAVFVDDFADYHALQGEIHCGTNSKRKGPLDRFWWEQEGI
ncbi:MAG: protein-arginine deiminase family protein, partial [Polyangiaceae bacterium]